MFTNLFGNYLVENGVINTQQFEAIKSAEAKTRVKLGLIAVAEKLMTQQQADAVNLKQSVMDLRFGDIAVDMGYLTRDQVKRLLGLQGNPYIRFTQTVTDLGVLTLEDVERELISYQKSKGYTSMDMDCIKSGDIDRIIPLILPDDMSWNVAEHIAVLVRTMNRLVCDDILLMTPKYIEKYEAKSYAVQNMFGDYEASTAMSGSLDGLLCVASGFAKEEFQEMGLEVLDSMGEYINIGNGLFATTASHDMIDITLNPPEYSENGAVLKADKICLLPLNVNGHLVDLMVSVDSHIEVENI